MERETQASISDWAEKTFGPAGGLASVATRANQEMAELLAALTGGAERERLAEEAADVKIVLYRLAARLGFDLDERLLKSREERISLDWNVAKANEALAKTIYCLLERNTAMAGWQVADCAVHLGFVASWLDVSLSVEVDEKMTLNRGRKWRLDGSGHGYHVKPETAVTA